MNPRLVALSGYKLHRMRGRPKDVQMLEIWGLIFFACLVAPQLAVQVLIHLQGLCTVLRMAYATERQCQATFDLYRPPMDTFQKGNTPNT